MNRYRYSYLCIEYSFFYISISNTTFWSLVFSPSPPPSSLKPPTPPRLAPLHRSRSLENLQTDAVPKQPSPPASACGHPSAGQELCYLCHQRARMNVPVSFTEERRRREEEEDRLLQQYQTMKDAEETLKDQVSNDAFKLTQRTKKYDYKIYW